MSDYQVYKRPMIQLVVGRCGCGKSFFTDQLIGELFNDGRDMAIIHDPHASYQGKVWRSVAEFRAVDHPSRRNVFHNELIPALVALTFDLAKAGFKVILVIDELNRAADGNGYLDKLPRKAGELRVPSPLERIVHEHRHYKIDLVGTCQRPVDLHPDFRSLAGRIHLFALTDHLDLNWVERSCSDLVLEKVKRLRKYECVHYDPEDTSDLERRELVSAAEIKADKALLARISAPVKRKKKSPDKTTKNNRRPKRLARR